MSGEETIVDLLEKRLKEALVGCPDLKVLKYYKDLNFLWQTVEKDTQPFQK